MNIDDLIRDSVRRQEELAVDPDSIRAGLPARAARRQRARTRAMLATVAAAVAVAVAVPAIALRDNGNDTGPVAAEQTANPQFYRPTWLPPGLVEQVRIITPENDTSRIWRNPANPDPDHNLVVETVPPQPADSRPAPNVDVNGAPGNYDGKETVLWWPDAKTELKIWAPKLGLSEEDLLRVARSVEPDPLRLQRPLVVGWLPDDLATHSVIVGGDSPTKWESVIIGQHAQRFIKVSVLPEDPYSPEIAGEPVSINGRTAYLESGDETTVDSPRKQTGWALGMDLGDGRQLTVRGGAGVDPQVGEPVTREEILRVAQSIQISPDPVEWIGQR